jgi:competence protein ComEC
MLPAWPSLFGLFFLTLCFFLLNRLPLSSKMGWGLLAIALGILWATLWGNWLMSGALPQSLDKTDYIVNGTIRGIPEQGERSTRFLFDLESIRSLEANQTDLQDTPELRRLVLNWYSSPQLQAGQRWQLVVRLRSPRGFVNAGGFDYRLWLLRRGVSATGYVRQANQSQLMGTTSGYALARYRQRIRKAIVDLDTTHPAVPAIARHLLVALTIGDKQGLSSDDWQKFRVSGTIHLLIVSGLHIGMAALVGLLSGSLLGRCFSALGFNCTRVQVGAVFGLMFASAYAAMAGSSLPTQRALVMLSVFSLAVISNRALRPWVAFIWAVTIQALLDPLAVLSAGFWLSYGAVATFIWYFSSRSRLSWQRNLVVAQALMLIMLAGLLIFFQGNVPLIAPIINFVALPWFGFLIVPAGLIGVLVFPVSHQLAEMLWRLATRQLQYFDQLLEWTAPYAERAQWQITTDQHFLLATAVIVTAILLLLPRGLGTRMMALPLIAALIAIEPPKGPTLDVTVLDVGQGLSIVVETREGLLIYDAGSKFSERFDAGSAIVAPYLRHLGKQAIDMLVVSHSDSDHSGGVVGLLNKYRAQRMIAGQPEALSPPGAEQCRAGMNWRFGEVKFEVIHPLPDKHYSDNDYSCVVVVRLGDQTILLTGDIGASTEIALLKGDRLPRQITLLVAPHHGSNSSSTPKFVTAVAPRHVVFSAGFNHHFGHPHAAVVRRYAGIKARQWRTGDSGAIKFSWQDKQPLAITEARRGRYGYWHESL